MPLILTLRAVSLHGKGITGIQGIGDPPAAATAGFTPVVHIPKGTIFKKGILSSAFAADNPTVETPLVGSTINGVGTVPQEHFKILVVQVAFDITFPEIL